MTLQRIKDLWIEIRLRREEIEKHRTISRRLSPVLDELERIIGCEPEDDSLHRFAPLYFEIRDQSNDSIDAVNELIATIRLKLAEKDALQYARDEDGSTANETSSESSRDTVGGSTTCDDSD